MENIRQTMTWKVDWYTKTVLTIIAISLALLVLKSYLIPTDVRAGGNPTEIDIVSVGGYTISGGVLKINIEEVNGSSIGSEIPIDLREIAGSSVDREIPVNIKEVGGYSISSSYGLPVNIEAINGSSISGGAMPVRNK